MRLRAATPADDSFFQQMEFDTTWESLFPEDRERLGREAVQAALAETHEALLSRPGNQVIIAETETGERVGLLWLGVNRNLVSGEDEAWVYNVSVTPGHRGQGIGRLLMEHAEQLARDNGYPVLGLMVAHHNEPARKLYERQGFRPTNLLLRKTLGR